MTDNTLDEIVIDELELQDETTEETVQVEEPVTPTVDDAKRKAEDLRKKQAGYYSRHPEELDLLIKEATELKNKGKVVRESVNNNDSDSLALKKVNELETQLALKDAVIEYGLTKDDLRFAPKNSTPDEIVEWAKEFADYKKSNGYNDSDDTNSDNNSPSNNQKYVKKTNSTNNTGKKQTLDELEAELHSSKITF
jgi:hypothetical protein